MLSGFSEKPTMQAMLATALVPLVTHIPCCVLPKLAMVAGLQLGGLALVDWVYHHQFFFPPFVAAAVCGFMALRSRLAAPATTSCCQKKACCGPAEHPARHRNMARLFAVCVAEGYAITTLLYFILPHPEHV
ncbi:MAG: hypothetical protein EBQ89_05315 [Alphaproteobacteria bacterium]|nr:hypothetical protein [Alphaproteobacteria bacterium]